MVEQKDTVQELLQQGIDAIKAWNKYLARNLLTQASELDPDNVAVWFWLSAAHEDLYEQEKCLRTVLALDPNNTLAVKGLGINQHRIVDEAFQRGVTAIQENNPELARGFFAEVVERDQNNIKAWEWLSQVAETSEDLEICYSNILSLDPENYDAREKLTRLKQTPVMSDPESWANEMDITENAGETRMNAPTLAGDILGRAYIEKNTTVLPEPEEVPELPSIALWARYEDVLGCPYCASPTELKQRRCPICNKPLWVSNQSTESHSTLLWFVIMLQAFSTIMLAVVPLVILFIVAQRLSIFNFFSLIPAYLGRPSPLNPNIVSAAFDILPRQLFFLSWVPALLTLFFAVSLYLRWAPIYYLMLVSAVFGLAGSIAVLAGTPAFEGSLFAGALGALLSLCSLIMVMKLESDFRKTRHRYYLDLDPGIEDGMMFLVRGKQYARKGIWALAAIHLRKAIAMMPFDAGSYMATAVACSQLHDYKLAQIILEDALRMDPENTRLHEALEVLATAQTEDTTTTETTHVGSSDDVKPDNVAYDYPDYAEQDKVAEPDGGTEFFDEGDQDDIIEREEIVWIDSANEPPDSVDQLAQLADNNDTVS